MMTNMLLLKMHGVRNLELMIICVYSFGQIKAVLDTTGKNVGLNVGPTFLT